MVTLGSIRSDDLGRETSLAVSERPDHSFVVQFQETEHQVARHLNHGHAVRLFRLQLERPRRHGETRLDRRSPRNRGRPRRQEAVLAKVVIAVSVGFAGRIILAMPRVALVLKSGCDW